MTNHAIYGFGLFELDPRAAELRRRGRPVPIQDQPLALLIALVEARGAVVERAELQRLLWPDGHHVDTEAGLNAAIRRAREAVGDAASNPRFIETVPKRGYRFIAPVDVVTPAPPARIGEPDPDAATSPMAEPAEAKESEPDASAFEAPTPPPPDGRPRPWLKPTLLVLGLWLVSLALLYLWFDFRSESRRDPPPTLPTEAPQALDSRPEPSRLAVLPFKIHGADSPDVESRFLADALADELILQLGRLDPERLQVIARTSVQDFRGRPTDLAELRRRLDVSHVLEGSVQQDGDEVRIVVALVDTHDQTRLADIALDRQAGSWLSLRLDVARKVAAAFAVELGQEQDELPDAAQRSYLEGRYFLSRITGDGLERAFSAFQDVVRLAPDHSLGHAGLATAWSHAAVLDFEPPLEAYPEALHHAREALRLDPTSGPACLAQALATHLYAWDLPAAEPWYEKALRFDPSAPAHLFVATYYSHLGDMERALALAEKAVELDPLAPYAHTQHCRLLFLARQPAEAEAACRRALELDPAFLEGWDVLKWLYIHEGREPQAIDAFLKVVELEEVHREAVPALRDLARSEGLDGLLRLSLESADGRLAEKGQSPYNLALDYAALDEPDAAFPWLQKAFETHETDMVALAVDPRLDSLRDDPRFRRLQDAVRAFPRRRPLLRDPAEIPLD